MKYALILYQLFLVIIVVRIIMDNRQPAKTMAWVLVIWFVPVLGVVFYLFFGRNTRKERFISQRSLDQLSKRSMLEFVEQKDLRLPEEHKQLISLFVNENLALPFKNSAVEVFTDGYAFFPALLSAIASARDHVHVEMYIFEDDPLGMLVSDALIAKARQGVEVRVIYDDVGCWKVSRRFFERMREEGIEVVPFLPVRFPSFTSKVNYRNHRKLVVVDGLTAFVGGMNIALRYVKGAGEHTKWRDTMLRITGNGVYGVQRAFLVDWYFVDRTLISNRKYYPAMAAVAGADTGPMLIQTVTSGPVTPRPEIMQGFVRIILSARRYVYIETPYFLPTEAVLMALKTAAVAGVDVRILVPFRADAKYVEWAGRSYLREVVEAGVRVLMYTAGLLHSKLLVSDDTVCTCGSTNVDFRSFENNFESNVFVYGEDTARQMRELYLLDEQHALPFDAIPRRMHPSFLGRLGESLVRLLSPLM